jgi:hypothetical protein
VAEQDQEAERWFNPELPTPRAPDSTTRLNYVIPNRLEHLLTQYCAQTQMKPGPLVRRLVGDFLKGEVGINVGDLEHPKGRRTSVDLPARLLAALEVRCEEIEAPTKAAVIAALLGDFLPPRVETEGIEKLTVSVPTSIYTKIYKRYGPGPDEEVLVEALCDLIQKNESKAIPAEQEA